MHLSVGCFYFNYVKSLAKEAGENHIAEATSGMSLRKKRNKRNKVMCLVLITLISLLTHLGCMKPQACE
jgi:hypothetical protein